MAHGLELRQLHEDEGRVQRIVTEILGLCEAARRAHYARRDPREFVNGIEWAARGLARELGRRAMPGLPPGGGPPADDGSA